MLVDHGAPGLVEEVFGGVGFGGEGCVEQGDERSGAAEAVEDLRGGWG